MEKSFTYLCAAALVVILATGCDSKREPATSDKLLVVATLYPLADWVKNVGGDIIQVETLIPAGASAHTFEPSPAEMRLVSKAKLFVRVGLQLDDWGAKLATAQSGLPVLALGDVLHERKLLPDVEHVVGDEAHAEDEATTPSEDEHHDHGHEGVNPHFWLDPLLAAESANLIRAELARIDPANAAVYEKNAREYVEKLRLANSEAEADLTGCKGRSFVSVHNAFPYLAKRYGLKIAAVVEEYPGKTPSERYVKELTTKLRQLQVKTVFAEPQLNSRVAEIIAAEVGAEVGILDPTGGPGVRGRDSYLALIKYNTEQLQKALCE